MFLRLKTSSAIPPLPLHAFMACTGLLPLRPLQVDRLGTRITPSPTKNTFVIRVYIYPILINKSWRFEHLRLCILHVFKVAQARPPPSTIAQRHSFICSRLNEILSLSVEHDLDQYHWTPPVSLHYSVSECHCSDRHLEAQTLMSREEYVLKRISEAIRHVTKKLRNHTRAINLTKWIRNVTIYMSRSSNLWPCTIVLLDVPHHPLLTQQLMILWIQCQR